MVEQFLKTVTNPRSADAYGRDLRRFIDWLGADRLAELDSDDLLSFVAHLQDEGLQPSSINRHLSSVKSFIKWAALTKKVPAAVYGAAQLVSGVKLPKKLPRALTPTEVERLLEQPDVATLAGARDYAFVQLALATGARLSELLDARVEDVDWERLRLIVDGKGDKQRVVLFTQEAANALVFYLNRRGAPASGSLFANEAGIRVSCRYMQRVISEYGHVAGIEDCHPHMLRHTFATELLDRSGDLDAVSKLMGHARPETTRRYTGLAVSRLEAVYRTAMQPSERTTYGNYANRRQPVPQD